MSLSGKMLQRAALFSAAVAVTALLAAGCVTRQVQRIDETARVDLSGRWNDTDSRLVSEEMVRDMFSRSWQSEFFIEKGRKPALVVGLVRNKSHELIPVDTFITDIERACINTGTARIVQAGEAREQLRQERSQQQGTATSETVKQWGKEIGADFILQGTINSIVDSNGREKVIFYQVDLELSNIETGEKVWIGTKKIKKLVKS